MYRHQEQVKEFNQKFNVVINDVPTLPDIKVRMLRVRLLLEEVLEFAKASGVDVFINHQGGLVPVDSIGIALIEYLEGVDIVLAADALTDIQYVNDGAAVAYGIDLEPCADEVHRSNMSKLWPYDVIKDRFLTEEEITSSVIFSDHRPFYREDGKIIKSPTYSPANLRKVLGL